MDKLNFVEGMIFRFKNFGLFSNTHEALGELPSIQMSLPDISISNL